MFGLADGVENVSKETGKAMPGLQRTDLRDLWLRAEKCVKLGSQIDQQTAQSAHRESQLGLPFLSPRFVLELQFSGERGKRCADRVVRDILLVLVELTLKKKTILLPDRSPKCPHQGGLPHPRI